MTINQIISACVLRFKKKNSLTQTIKNSVCGKLSFLVKVVSPQNAQLEIFHQSLTWHRYTRWNFSKNIALQSSHRTTNERKQPDIAKTEGLPKSSNQDLVKRTGCVCLNKLSIVKFLTNESFWATIS